MTSGIETGIRDIVARVAKVAPDFDGTADLFREIGVKSAAALDLLLSIEEEFGVSITDDAFGEARTAEKLVQLVSSLKGAAA